jgi:tRNA-specific 2-thiouridylase
VAHALGIPIKSIDLQEDYWNRVFAPTLQEFTIGRTPNPDALCNREIKFGVLKDMLELEADDLFVTGHYARMGPDSSLFAGKYWEKDQSWFLSRVQRAQFSNVWFPVGHLSKTEVVELATLHRLPFDRKSSRGLCLVGKHKSFREFLCEYVGDDDSLEGEFVCVDSGRVLGQHKGIWRYSVGQRARLQSHSAYYVTSKDTLSNTVYVSDRSDHPLLFCRVLHLDEMNWISAKDLAEGEVLKCPIHYRGELIECLYRGSGMLELTERKMKSVDKGNVIVLYRNDGECVGSGVVNHVEL